LRESKIDEFSASEIAIIDEVIRQFWGETADKVSQISHGIAWKVVNDKESIPYETAYLSDNKPTAEDVSWAQELIQRYEW
jgi:hypothetical protein